MKVELLDRNGKGIAVGGRKPGRIMDVSGGVADMWIGRGQAKLVPEDTKIERMVPDHSAERMNRNRRGG